MTPESRAFEPGGPRELWNLALPVVLSMLAHTVMWTVDTIMVGRLGSAELAAVGLGGVIVWTLSSFFVGVVTSVMIFVAQESGAGHPEECSASGWQGIYLAAVSGILILGLRELMGPAVALIGPSPDVAPLSVEYMRARMLAGFFLVFNFSVGNFFRGVGNMKTPMWILTGANLGNVLLDWLLIFGHLGLPRLEVAGAGYATAISNALASIAFAWRFLSPATDRVYRTRVALALRLAKIRRMLRVGIPVGVHHVADMTSFTIFTAYISRMGTAPLAAHQIVLQVLSFSFMPSQALGVAAGTLVGQYLGADRPRVARRSGMSALRLGTGYALATGAAYLLLSEPILSLFTRDPGVIASGRSLIRLAALFQVFDALQLITSGTLRGASDTRWPMILQSVLAYLFFLPAAYLLGTVLGLGVTGAWLGATTYVVLLAGTMALRFWKGPWMTMRV